MLDALRPLTLLLGATSLWALSVLVLALAGLGSRIAAPQSTPPPPRLPLVSLTRSQSRLGPLETYAEVGQRPLMNENRQPSIQVAVSGENANAELDVVLTSVLITPRLQLAILTGNKDATARRVRVGDMVEGSNWRLVGLQPRSATIEGPGGQRVLELRVFNGRGGEMPTPTVSAAAKTGASERPEVATVAANVPPPAPSTVPTPANAADQQAAQQQQIEAIRRRIEARRAQMRAEAESSSAQEK